MVSEKFEVLCPLRKQNKEKMARNQGDFLKKGETITKKVYLQDTITVVKRYVQTVAFRRLCLSNSSHGSFSVKLTLSHYTF